MRVFSCRVFESVFGVWFVVQLFFFLDWQEKKYVAAENKERNLNLLQTDIFMMSIVPAVGGNCMLMRTWIK